MTSPEKRSLTFVPVRLNRSTASCDREGDSPLSDPSPLEVRMAMHKRTTFALLASAALIIPAAPAGAATVSDPIVEELIAPLGLAVDGEDVWPLVIEGTLAEASDMNTFLPDLLSCPTPVPPAPPKMKLMP